MEFVPGKFYRTREGQKVYCIGRNPHARQCLHDWVFAVVARGDIFTVRNDGRRFDTHENGLDIIGEWQEPVTVTRWWFAVMHGDGTFGHRTMSSIQDAEQHRNYQVSLGKRVGPIEEITTVVP